MSVLILIVCIIFVQIYFETNFPKVNFINIKSNKLHNKDSIKVLQITDYHNFKRNKAVLKLVEEAKADVIVITGDLIDSATKNYSNVYNFIESVLEINPNIYYVPGNHEFRSGNMESFIEELRKRKVKVLLNTNEVFKIHNKEINICGLNYSSSDFCDLDETLKGTDNGIYTIMLSHRPDIVKYHDNIACDLILCGHTHGGQIRLPLIGALIAPDQGIFPKYNKDLYKVGNNTLLYIDSGVGTTRIPVRFFNRSQISLITLEN